MLGVEVPLLTPHRLEQVLTRDNLRTQKYTDVKQICFTIVFTKKHP